MPAKPFVIETRSFPRKQDAVEYFRSMLHRYTPHDRVSDQDARVMLGKRRLEKRCPSDGGPRVRIHLPPAGSPVRT
jgi:hypothetical protein